MGDSYTAISAFEVFSGVIAVAFFIWSVCNRQGRSSEPVKFSMLEYDAEEDFSRGSIPASPRSVRMLMAVVIAVFLFIAWSVVITIQAATHTPAASGKMKIGMPL